MAKDKPQPPADPVKKPGDLAHGIQRERGLPKSEVMPQEKEATDSDQGVVVPDTGTQEDSQPKE